MRTHTDIEGVVRSASKAFSEMLADFYPAFGYNDFNEKNIVLQLSQAFHSRYWHPQQTRKSRIMGTFLELPVCKTITKDKPRRIDGYFYNSNYALFVECKRLYSKEKSEQVIADIHRLRKWVPALLRYKWIDKTIRKHIPVYRPNRVYQLIVCSHWDIDSMKSTVNWWEKGSGQEDNHWCQDDYPTDMKYRSLLIRSYPEWGDYYWLYCYAAIDITD